jgi:hypothetical protein
MDEIVAKVSVSHEFTLMNSNFYSLLKEAQSIIVLNNKVDFVEVKEIILEYDQDNNEISKCLVIIEQAKFNLY